MYTYYRPALLDFDADIEEEEAVPSCVTCDLQPAQKPHLQCGACRLAFKTQNMTPPGKLRNKKNALKKACSDCKVKPARAVGTKCSNCIYKHNKTPCSVCGVTGVKIQRGMCATHYNQARRHV